MDKFELDFLRKHKRQARQCHPNLVVVPLQEAINAVERAFAEGYKKAIS